MSNMKIPVDIDSLNAITPHFIGVGVEWDSRGYPGAGVTAEDFALIRKRVEWMRLPTARIMVL